MPLCFLRFLLGKFADMQTFAGESMTAEGGMAFGYYKEGAHNPTFAYISKSLEAEKVHVVGCDVLCTCESWAINS